jgi:hypothetical protein
MSLVGIEGTGLDGIERRLGDLDDCGIAYTIGGDHEYVCPLCALSGRTPGG